eukprot:PhM_4_TR5170/c0_g1_i1/m.27100
MFPRCILTEPMTAMPHSGPGLEDSTSIGYSGTPLKWDAAAGGSSPEAQVLLVTAMRSVALGAIDFTFSGWPSREFQSTPRVYVSFHKNVITTTERSVLFYILHNFTLDVTVPRLPLAGHVLVVSVILTKNATVSINATTLVWTSASPSKTLSISLHGTAPGEAQIMFKVISYADGYLPPQAVNIKVKPLETVQLLFDHPHTVYVRDVNAATVFFKVSDPTTSITITPIASHPAIIQFDPKVIASPTSDGSVPSTRITALLATDTVTNIRITYKIFAATTFINAIDIVASDVRISPLFFCSRRETHVVL